jgi:hypothetical protein
LAPEHPGGSHSVRREAAAYPQRATTTFVLAEYVHRAGILRRDDALDLILTGRLKFSNGVRIFCVTGPRHPEAGVEARADDRVEEVIIDVQLVALLAPLSHSSIRGKTSRLSQGLLQPGQHVRGEL